MDAPEVIVIGAGPVGLCTTLGLARAGRRVLLLEKEPGTAERSRAPAIWARSQEVLAGLDVLERFVAEGITLGTVHLWDADDDAGRELLSIPVHELGDVTKFPRLLLLPQSSTERLLCEAVSSQPTAWIIFSAEAVGVEQHDSRVTVRYVRADAADVSDGAAADGRADVSDGAPADARAGATHSVEAPFVVAADGAGSTIRDVLGASFEGRTYRLSAALADVRGAIPQNLPFPRLTSSDGLAIGIRIGADIWRLILPFRERDDLPLEERVQRAAARLFPSVVSARDYEIVWQSEFELHQRMASRFAWDRVVLAGDAAHLNSPVGGQGMNAGIQDAAALIPALLEALDSGSPAPLQRYETTRQAAVQQGVNRFTDLLTRVLLLRRGSLIRPVLAMARRVLTVRPLRRRFLRRIALQV
jgi:3-(3-hydroxy-phenyl)propionate hydroxylase